MSIEAAYKLYNESNPETAVSPRARYNFAAKYLTDGQLWLDIGSNLGHGITDANRPSILLDINREYLIKQNGSKIQANGVSLPFPSESMDLITLFEVIEHVPEMDSELMLQEVKRVIKPNGKIILSTPNKGVYGNKLSSPDHIQEFNEEDLNRFFYKAKLKILEKYGQGFTSEQNLVFRMIRFARDNRLISWIYYHGPLKIRNKLRVGIQKTVKSDEIRFPDKNETEKNFIFILKPIS